MVQTQFSPRQVLEAAQRADAEGRLDYALQFYRHLMETAAGTPEARAAEEAIGRLTRAAPTVGQQPLPHHLAPTNGTPPGEQNNHRPQLTLPPQPHHGPPVLDASRAPEQPLAPPHPAAGADRPHNGTTPMNRAVSAKVNFSLSQSPGRRSMSVHPRRHRPNDIRSGVHWRSLRSFLELSS